MNMKKALLPISLVALFGIGSSAHAAMTIEQLTTNSINDSLPHISGNYVVWQGYVGGNWEVFLHDLTTSTTTQITSNSTDDISPQTDGNYITWMGEISGGSGIFSYNISTGGPALQIDPTPGTHINAPPQIADGRIVWVTNVVGTNVNPGEISFYEIATGTHSVISNLVDPGGTLDDNAPKINSTQVVWNQVNEGVLGDPTDDVTSIVAYDIAAGTASYLIVDVEANANAVTPVNFVWEESPQSDGDLSVYAQHDGSDREIFLKNDRLLTQQVTANSISDTYPRISGNTVVWVGGDGDSAEIYVATDPDEDTDGVTSSFDNCTVVANELQRDSDGDGFGNKCDADFDNNGYVNYLDFLALVEVYGTSDVHADFDGNGYVNYLDFLALVALYGQPPGPSGLVP